MNLKLSSQNLDHIGIVAGICLELKIAERINKFLGIGLNRKITPGLAVVAMILNGLGFVNRTLYLTGKFFKNKPVNKLLNTEGLLWSDLTDDTLGDALSDIGKYGATKLFSQVAHEIAIEHNLLGSINRIDTTSISVEGEYNNSDSNSDPLRINITNGFSKNNRPDLKQFVLSMVVSGAASLPIWCETLDGNSSDSTSFHNTIADVRAFQDQVCTDTPERWVADSKLYSADKLLSPEQTYLWVSRVPESITEAKELVQKSNDLIEWTECGNGYKISNYPSSYGGLNHRWLLVHSEQSRVKELKTFAEKMNTLEEAARKKISSFEKKVFACEKDALKELAQLNKKEVFFEFCGTVIPVEKYENPGRPKKDEKPKVIGYSVQCDIKINQDEVTKVENSKGRFILATNDMNKETYSDKEMLKDYKDQHHIERGFRYFKDPFFMMDKIFLKDEIRISALMMVMTLCLFIYNYSQHKIREILEKTDDTLPNQLKKEVKNPTLRWIFQLMDGISIVKVNLGSEVTTDTQPQEVVTNLDRVQLKIIRLMGESVCHMYNISLIE